MVDIQSSIGYTAAVGRMLADEVAMCVNKVNLHLSTFCLVDLIWGFHIEDMDQHLISENTSLRLELDSVQERHCALRDKFREHENQFEVYLDQLYDLER